MKTWVFSFSLPKNISNKSGRLSSKQAQGPRNTVQMAKKSTGLSQGHSWTRYQSNWISRNKTPLLNRTLFPDQFVIETTLRNSAPKWTKAPLPDTELSQGHTYRNWIWKTKISFKLIGAPFSPACTLKLLIRNSLPSNIKAHLANASVYYVGLRRRLDFNIYVINGKEM